MSQRETLDENKAGAETPRATVHEMRPGAASVLQEIAAAVQSELDSPTTGEPPAEPGPKQLPPRQSAIAGPDTPLAAEARIDPVQSPVWLWLALLLSLAWFALCGYYATVSIGLHNLVNLLPHEFGGFLVGAIAPPALLWLMLGSIRRNASLRATTDMLNAHLAQLTYPSEQGSRRLNEINDLLRRQADELVSRAGATAASVAKARELLALEVGRLSELSVSVSKQIEAAGTGLDQRVRGLSELAERLGQTSGTVTSAIDGFTQSTQGIAEGFAGQVTEALGKVEQMTAGLGEAGQRLVQAAGEGGTKIEQAARHMDDRSESLLRVSIESGERLTAAVSRLDAQREQITVGAERLRETADQSATQLGETLQRATGAATAAHGQMGTAMAQFDERVGSFGELVGRTDQRLGQLHQDFRRHLDEFAGATDQVAARAGALQEDLQQRAQELHGVAANIQAGGQQAAQELHQQAAALGEVSAAASSRVREVIVQFTEGAGQLDQAAHRAAESVTTAGGYFAEQQRALRDAGQHAAEQVAALDSRLSSSGAAITAAAAAAAGELQRVIAALDDSHLRGEGSSRQSLQTLHEMRGQLSTLRDEIDQTIDRAKHRIGEVNEAFDGRLEALRSGSSGAADLLLEAANAVHGVANRVHEQLRASNGEMSGIHTALEQQANTAQAAVHDAQSRLEATRRLLSETASEFTSTAAAAAAQLEHAGGSFAQRTDEIAGRAGVLVEQMSHAALAAQREIEQLGSISAGVSNRMDESGRALMMVVEQIGGRGDLAAGILARAQLRLATEASDLEQRALRIRDQLGELAGRMRSDIGGFTADAETAGAGMQQSASVLRQEAEELVGAADRLNQLLSDAARGHGGST